LHRRETEQHVGDDGRIDREREREARRDNDLTADGKVRRCDQIVVSIVAILVASKNDPFAAARKNAQQRRDDSRR
jgi:hypothetical protein